jgi:adenylate cyclase
VAQIVDIKGNKTYTLGVSNTVGRDPASTIVIKDLAASRTHAEIRATPEGRYVLVDLKSTHGTYVAGKKVTELVLNHGDEIFIGTTHFRFQDPKAAAANKGDVQVAQAATPFVQKKIAVSSDEQFKSAKDIANPQDLHRSYEKLRAAYALSRAIGTEHDLDATLQRILDTAFKLLPADRAVILLRDPATGAPTPRLTKQRTPDGDKIVLSNTILNEVMSSKSGLILADTGQSMQFGAAKSIVASGIRSAMCVPIMYAGELLGIMHLDSLIATNVFKDQDLELFSSIANQAAVAIKNQLLTQSLQNEAKARVQFQRFLPPSLVDQMVRGDLRLTKGGELHDITVLFSDIRGFTRMSEGMGPGEVMDLLNEYFEIMIEVLFLHRGTFDKYVGDELMALFGVPVPLANAPLAAVACALDMKRALKLFNDEQTKKGKQTLNIGIGIHTGEALCGMLGSSKTMQYTAIGDTVNTGARLCGICAADQVVISEKTLAAIGEGQIEYDTLPPATVKGKSQALNIFNVKALTEQGKSKHLTGKTQP